LRKKTPIFYSALMLTGVNLLLRLAGTSFQVYISGRIGAAGVGLLQLVMSVGGLAMTAGMAGIRTTSMYLTAEQLEEKREDTTVWVLSACFLYSILCSAAVSTALFFAAPYIAENWIGNILTISSLRLLAAFLPVSCLVGVMAGYFTAAGRIGTLAAVEVAEQALSIAATLLLLKFWAGTDPAIACAAVVAGSGISGCVTLVALVVLRIKEKQDFSSPIPIRRRLLACALPLAGADIVKSGISTTENILVPKRLALYRSAADPLAAFGTVCGMVFPVVMFPAAILYGLAELLIPELARCAAAGSGRRIRYLVRRSLKTALLYGCVFCAVLVLLSEELCCALYGNTEAAYWMRRYALLIPMLYCDAITDAMTKGLGQQRACVRYNIITSFLDVVLLFFLLPSFGMQGYFISFTLTHLLNFILSIRRLAKVSAVRLSGRTAIVAVASTGVGIWIASFVKPVPGSLFCLIIIGCLMVLGKIIGREEVIWLKGLLQKK